MLLSSLMSVGYLVGEGPVRLRPSSPPRAPFPPQQPLTSPGLVSNWLSEKNDPVPTSRPTEVEVKDNDPPPPYPTPAAIDEPDAQE
jgi:hypothetical protein